MKPRREQYEQALRYEWLRAVAAEDGVKEARLARKLKALDKRPELPDITSLEPFPVHGPKLSWGPPASEADRRRRETDRLLQKHGVRYSRW